MSENTVEEIVTEMKSPGKFKILDVIKDRSFPTEDVDIFIDEQMAYAAASMDDPDRNTLFTELLWQKHIVKITAPDGSVQDGVSLEDVSELRRSLPIAATGKLTEAIEKIRTATAVFMFSADEDFLAKS
jgi:hypothetical protein